MYLLSFTPFSIGPNVDTLLPTYSRAEKKSGPHNALRMVLGLGFWSESAKWGLRVHFRLKSALDPVLIYIRLFVCRTSIRKVPPLGTTHYVGNMYRFLGSSLRDGFFDYSLYRYFLQCKMFGVWFEIMKHRLSNI